MYLDPGPSDDPFLPLYSSSGHHNISAFVNSYYQFVKDSDNPSWSLASQFLVNEIGVGKSHTTVQHESFTLWGSDERTKKCLELIMDHVPSKHSYTSRFSSFSRFPDSDNVLTSIQQALLNMRSITTQAAGSIVAAIKTETETETIPLLPLASESPPMLSTSSTSHPNIPQLSLIDTVTSTLAKAVAAAHSASQSISPQSLAQDSIWGYPLGSLKPEECILTFKPVGLTAFDVALIAKVVHDYAPIYGLFDNQCYMFARVIFDVIVQLFSLPQLALDPDSDHPSTSIHNTAPVPAPSREVDAPNNANIVIVPSPDLAGRWAGLLVLDPIVRSTIVSIVIDRFRLERPLYNL